MKFKKIFVSIKIYYATLCLLTSKILNFQELLYHSIAFGLLLAASLTLLVHINNNRRYNYELLLGASVSTILYS